MESKQKTYPPKLENFHYPRMTALKSKCNQLRQIAMNKGIQWLQKKSDKSVENPYLHGIYAPTEEVERTQFKIQGQIPEQLTGILLRIGPNPIHVENPALHHWFSGEGMIHGLKIEHGQVQWFKSKYIATDTVQKEKKQTLKSGFRRGPGDIVNTNAFYFSGKIWAVIEAGTFPVCLDLNLNTERHQLFNSDADLPFTAHPHEELATGNRHAICYDALDQKHLYYEVLDPQGQLIHLAKIPVEHGPMVHDCAITEHEILVFDFPVTFSKKQVMRGNNMPYAWNPQHPARVGVLPLYGQANEVKWHAVGEDAFVFHTANAYRDAQDQIVLDVIVHDRMFDQSKQGPFEQQKTQLERWLIGPQSTQVQRQVLDSSVQEFPRIDERFIGQDCRYIYAVSYDVQSMMHPNQLYIHDLKSNQKTSFAYGDEWITGEVIFIAASQNAPEGVGYLVSYVHHVDALASKVVILKVNGLTVQPQAEIDLGVHIPLGFHCNWADLSELPK